MKALKLSGIMMLIFTALLLTACSEEKEEISALDKVNDSALDFISKNNIELPLSVSLDEIEDLKSSDFEFDASSLSGTPVAAATDKDAAGTTSSKTLTVGISLASSLARAQVAGVTPQALVINAAEAFLSVLPYDADIDKYIRNIYLGNDKNYICIILFKNGTEWKKTGFIEVTVTSTKAPSPVFGYWDTTEITSFACLDLGSVSRAESFTDVMNVEFHSYHYFATDGNMYIFTQVTGELSVDTDIQGLTANQVFGVWLWEDPIAFNLSEDETTMFVDASEGLMELPMTFSNEDDTLEFEMDSEVMTWQRAKDSAIFKDAELFPWRETMQDMGDTCM